MQRPGFWDEQARAASVSAEHSRATRKLESFRNLESELDDLETLTALTEEDDSLAAELDEQLASVTAELERLEEERLFPGRYDSGGAVVSVHSGAGGHHSHNWGQGPGSKYPRWEQR